MEKKIDPFIEEASMEELKEACIKSCREINHWRKWFLKKNDVDDLLIKTIFMCIPSDVFIGKGPEDHLIDGFKIKLEGKDGK